ncbi:heparinase II/III family protein [bacterium]|nr:heparinase II/III family protein [bacterium]
MTRHVWAGLVLAVVCGPALAQEAANMTGLKSHPCALVNAGTLALLRAKAADATPNAFGFETAAIWAELKARADRLAAAPTYSYKVNCPGENRVTLDTFEYTLSDQTPPKHDKSPNYPPWTAMFQENEGSITTRLVAFSFAYLVTGAPEYFEKAKEIALHLAHWDQWTDPSYGAGRIKACLDTGHCMYATGLFYDWCYDRLTEAERTLLREAIVNKGIIPALGYVDHYPSDTNGYAVITAGAGLAALAIRPEEPRGGEFLQACLDKTRVSLDHGGKDGGMFEGPMYGTYLMDSFALFFDGLISAQVQHDLFDHPYLKTMDKYCVGMLAPDTRQIPCFSDGSPGIAVPRLMSILAQRGSTDAAWYLQTIGAVKPEKIYDFIRFDASKLKPVQPTWNPSVACLDIGYASLRDSFNAQAPSLFFKSGPTTNSIGHNHYDHNAFVISYGGQWIIPDRGYHDFYAPARRKFSLGSLGHCTVVLDADDAYFHDQTVPAPGHEQVCLAGGQIVDFFGGQHFDFVKGRAGDTYSKGEPKVLSRFDRSIIYLKPDAFVIRDQLAAPLPHRFSFLLHCDGNGDIEPAGDHFLVTRGNAQVWAQTVSPTPTQAHVETYPGAEGYGSFLRVETEPTATAGFVTVLIPRPWQSENYLRNGGFEKGMAGWAPRANEDLPNHRIETEGVAEGKQCASIEKSGYYYSDRFGLPAGTAVTATVQVRTTPLPQGQGATMTLYFWRGGKAFANKRVGPFADTVWTEHTLTAKVPEGTEEASLALEFFAPGKGSFDHVRLSTDLPVVKTIEPQVKRLADEVLDLTTGQDRFLVSFGEAGKMREVAGIKSDGEAAVVAFVGGKVVRGFVVGGTVLEYQSRRVIAQDKAGTAEADL